MSSHRLFIDLQAAQSSDSGHRGLGRYAVELTGALIRNGAPIDSVGLNPLLPTPMLPAEIVDHAHIVDIDAETLDRARSKGPLAYHVMSPMQAPYDIDLVLPRAIERADALVSVVYDLIPFLFADPYLMRDNSVEHHLGRLRHLKTADLLLAISDRTRLDFIEHLGVEPDRIVNIGTGVSSFFSPAEPGHDSFAEAARAVPAIDRPFIMSVPAFEWRKNAGNLIRAFARTKTARNETRLVIACSVPPHGEKVWRALVREVGLDDDDVVITGFVDDATLRSLYRATRLFVFPSRYEGFGLPVAEAARCGAPCITSDRGSLTEVLDLAASTFDPENVEEMATVIDRALTDEDLRAELFAASGRSVAAHSWDNTALRAIEAYGRLDRVAAPYRSRARKPLVAVVGPMPPVASGVAVYTARVLDEIDPDRLDIDVYADSVPVGSWPPAMKARRLFPAAALGVNTNPHDYDAIVYCLGTSRFHIDTLNAMRRCPGIVWTHDANLMGLYLEWAERLQWELKFGWRGERDERSVDAILRDEARSTYGDRVPETMFATSRTYADYVDTGVKFAASAIARAKHVIVNSTLARDLIVDDFVHSAHPIDATPSISVLAHAVPTAQMVRRTASTRSARPTVVALGFCVPRKRPLVIVEAIAKLARPVDLVFVGSCVPALEREIDTLARRLGVRDQVLITDYVSDAEYGAWLGRAQCAVQLRDIDFGESTGTVHDAIAARLPVITSVRSCRELPPGTVVNVDQTVTAERLAAALDDVLFDDATRIALDQAMRDYAESWRFADVAEQFVEIVESAIPASSKDFLISQRRTPITNI
ncbi:MAG: glycosyltransferase [Actinobacteria bacterium]|nr:MAG: glycosyltransferase [Actinomycetota bacterium]